MTVANWLEAQARADIQVQRSKTQAAQILVTFTVGISIALIASALQVVGRDWRVFTSLGLLVAALLFAILVFAFDDVREPYGTHIAANGFAAQRRDNEVLITLREKTIAIAEENRQAVRTVVAMAFVQLVLAVGAGVFATLSMLANVP